MGMKRFLLALIVGLSLVCSPLHEADAGKTYSGSSSSGSKAPASRPPASGGKSSTGGGKTFSGGGKSSSGSSKSPSATPSRPSPSGTSDDGWSFDSSASKSQKRAESEAAYRQAEAEKRASRERAYRSVLSRSSDDYDPLPTYKVGNSGYRSINKNDPWVRTFRKNYNYGLWQTRSDRQARIFGANYNIYNTRTAPTYSDPYGSLFWWWLLDQSYDQQAMWAYNHRSVMDQSRYNFLINQNSDIRARVSQLESMNNPRDPTFVPLGIDRDIMYSDDYVRAAANVDRAKRDADYAYSGDIDFSGLGTFFKWVIYIIFILIAAVVVIWIGAAFVVSLKERLANK